MEVQDQPRLAQYDMDAWNLFDAGSYYETKDFDTFKAFLNSRGTKKIELNTTPTEFTVVARGSGKDEGGKEEKGTSCVLFHQVLTGFSRPKKLELVDMIHAHPGIPTIERDRMGNTLASYFGVQKELQK